MLVPCSSTMTFVTAIETAIATKRQSECALTCLHVCICVCMSEENSTNLVPQAATFVDPILLHGKKFLIPGRTLLKDLTSGLRQASPNVCIQGSLQWSFAPLPPFCLQWPFTLPDPKISTASDFHCFGTAALEFLPMRPLARSPPHGHQMPKRTCCRKLTMANWCHSTAPVLLRCS